MKNNVGIIIVSYNAPEAVVMTLDALANTPVCTPFSVALVDNASTLSARSTIAACMEQHLTNGSLSGRFFPLTDNKGFSGGNNIGLAYFLAQPEITHLCLLNSDVVVSDYWLDYLLEEELDAVGPLTNASNNEQGIPVPYAISRNGGKMQFDKEAYLYFAAQRREQWKGYVCPSDFVSFFCTVFTRRLVQRVGYLDTRFHPGAYEDDDYCVRILENGFSMHVRRDVYLHHWGSASFRLLTATNGARNRKRFIDKHKQPWQDRTHLPWRAWLQDARYVLSQPSLDVFSPTMDLYKQEILALSQAMDERYASLIHAIKNIRETKIEPSLQPWQQTRQVQRYFSWRVRAKKILNILPQPCRDAAYSIRDFYRKVNATHFQTLKKRHFDLLSVPNTSHNTCNTCETKRESLKQATLAVQTLFDEQSFRIPLQKADLDLFAQAGEQLENSVRWHASAISTMEEKLKIEEEYSLSIMAPALSDPYVSEDLWTLLQAIDKGVLFFAGYPYPERLNDGYFQRVKAIDELVPKSHFRIYCDVSPAFSGENVLRRISQNTLLLQVNPSNVAHQLLVANCAQRCKKVYYHSVLRMEYPIQNIWLAEKGIHKILDVHGVVPEEFIYCSGDYTSSAFYSDIESRSVRECDTIVVVSDAMGEHLSHKYAEDFKEKLISVPILPVIPINRNFKEHQPKRLPRLVYAGGTHPWQCIPRMLEAIRCIIEWAEVDIFATAPQDIEKLGSRTLLAHPNFSLGTIPHEELCKRYPSYDYGFLLREDVSVNRAACPTKLVEYLYYGIVPVLSSPYIGDFEKLGMRYVHVTDLEQGAFLSQEQREAYVQHNVMVLDELKQRTESNTLQLRKILAE